jgi:hypothetical protein
MSRYKSPKSELIEVLNLNRYNHHSPEIHFLTKIIHFANLKSYKCAKNRFSSLFGSEMNRYKPVKWIGINIKH